MPFATNRDKVPPKAEAFHHTPPSVLLSLKCKPIFKQRIGLRRNVFAEMFEIPKALIRTANIGLNVVFWCKAGMDVALNVARIAERPR